MSDGLHSCRIGGNSDEVEWREKCLGGTVLGGAQPRAGPVIC